MKDSEFIELLNLYLDHEISAADAARLEAEVQSNPARRQIYRDYCRMQKACKLMAEDFTRETAAAPDSKVIAFEPARPARSTRAPWYLAGAGIAAAACVAVVFGLRNEGGSAPSPTSETIVQAPAAATPESNAPVIAANASQAAPATGGIERRPASSSLSLRDGSQPQLALTGVQNDPRFAWMNDVRLAPIQMPTPEQSKLEATRATENRTYSSNKPLPPEVLPIAIRFQK